MSLFIDSLDLGMAPAPCSAGDLAEAQNYPEEQSVADLRISLESKDPSDCLAEASQRIAAFLGRPVGRSQLALGGKTLRQVQIFHRVQAVRENFREPRENSD
jgi:hypothetical protein